MPPIGEDTPLIVSRTSSLSSNNAGVLRVHLYHQPNVHLAPDSVSSLTFMYGEYTAEELCVAAAKACGILPVCHSLFALATEDLKCWFPPNHVFTVEESCSQVVVYRIRFCFPDWFGPRKSYRVGLMNEQANPVLDFPAIDYLFAQVRSDFIHGKMDVPLTLEAQETCLGLAVLDMLRISKERKETLGDVFRSISYKSCLPEKLRGLLQAKSFVTRKRIRHQFCQSLRRVSSLQTEEHSLKMKYLMELEGMEGATAKETFPTRVPGQTAKEATRLIHVSGEKGISLSHSGDETCHPFCDFPDIVDITIKQASREALPVENRIVNVTKMDSQMLEMEFPTLREALSFVSLIDGYYRLTVDAHHYFCKEVAPPRLLEDLENQCHGPITSEFAINKLKTMGYKEGSYILRRSLENFDSYLLTTCTETVIGKDFKSLLIQKNRDGTFSTAGVTKKFCSLRELLGTCQQFSLQADGTLIQLHTHCPPQPKEKSNLLIVRGGSCRQLPISPSAPRRTVNQMMFHKIQAENLTQDENLGQGTFTRIYRGLKHDTEEEEDAEEGGEAGIRAVEVVMKVLDLSHIHWVEPFLEAASMISQLSHKHLILLYGVSIGAENIMVQEYIRHGALDTYLRRNQATGKVTATWKLQVAKQLAYALNFLEDKKVPHGNVSAKKVLLAREGDATSGRPPFIKLSDPGVSVTVLNKDLLIHRIPWVAPECLEDPKNLTLESDKWSFGATLWEIFNGGNMPLSAMEPGVKLKFCQDQQQLPPLKWTELANVVAQCMDYSPPRRPAFRALIRDLNCLITSDYELLSDLPMTDSFGGPTDMSTYQGPTIFEDRHLKYISVLGKGNFGSVELCRYDPLGDSTGELVAVKRLQQSSAKQQQDFEREIAILRSLHHDFIVAYRGVCYSRGRNCLRLVMEYLPNSCLRNYLQKNQARLDIKKLLLYAWQVCKGMEYLGSQRYIHRDLAARNILVENENRVKIGDFGLAKILPQGKEYYVMREPGQSPIFWYAPESLTDNIFSQESDVWSFGVVLYELFTYGSKSHSPSEEFLHMMGHRTPPQLIFHLLDLLKENKRLPSPAGCPMEVYTLMQSCWAFAPHQRPQFCKLGPQIEALRNSHCKPRG
ncbi:tyrosine-protein kinase JAK3 [Hemicordylus capensis]|uniref:tyrosine-protein kinase JAK3 n=1 Tax=Hemicordylus capensis TaxID=884348 RepID=UPI002303331A|nr:tyrosine-protein kinase JAK3 [Hemicordylus capensis]XP_053159555.1 tyrosine-protein kinase JAK3 [Hemicordylus capensis]